VKQSSLLLAYFSGLLRHFVPRNGVINGHYLSTPKHSGSATYVDSKWYLGIFGNKIRLDSEPVHRGIGEGSLKKIRLDPMKGLESSLLFKAQVAAPLRAEHYTEF
jgi:hypothetical protein